MNYNSAFSFVWDMLLVSGIVPASGATAGNPLNKLTRAGQLSARLAVLFLTVTYLWQTVSLHSCSQVITTKVLLFAVCQLLAAILVFSGTAARISSGIGLGLIGVSQIFTFPSPVPMLLVVSYVVIVFLGSGPYSLWTPEEKWYHSHPDNRPDASSSARSTNETIPQTT